MLTDIRQKIKRQVLEEYELNVSIDCFTDWEKLESDDKIYDLFFSNICEFKVCVVDEPFSDLFEE